MESHDAPPCREHHATRTGHPSLPGKPGSLQHQPHFVGRREAERLIQSAPELAGMQGNGGKALAAAPLDARLSEQPGDAFATMLRVDIEIEEIRTPSLNLPRARRRGLQQDSDATGDLTAGSNGKPSAILSAGDRILQIRVRSPFHPFA